MTPSPLNPSPADDLSDRELVELINQGDMDAFGVLYHRHRDWVVRLAYRYTADWDDSLDVLQETFAYLAGKFPGFELSASITTFLFPVVKHSAIALRKKRRKFTPNEPIPEIPVPPATPGQPDLALVLGGLSDAHREVLLMRFVDDMSLEEIAQSLQVPLGTVKSRIHHALSCLRDNPATRKYFEIE